MDKQNDGDSPLQYPSTVQYDLSFSEKGLALNRAASDDWEPRRKIRVALKVCLSLVSITSGAVISQWQKPDSLQEQQSSRCFLDLQPDVLVGTLALWGISTIGLRKLYLNDRHCDHAIVIGAMAGLLKNLYSSICSGDWTSFGSYVMVGVSICMALGIPLAALYDRNDVHWR